MFSPDSSGVGLALHRLLAEETSCDPKIGSRCLERPDVLEFL